MSITSLVYMNDMSFLGENDMLAAFVGDDLRGVSQALFVPNALGHALTFQILIYSNLQDGEVVSFKYYNFEDDTIYDLNESVDYNFDTFLGNVNDPLLFTYNLVPNYYNLNLENTGESALFIFTDNISLGFGDEIGLFDLNGIQETSVDCSYSIGETLVGNGVWQNEQTEIVAIKSVDLCEFGGFLLAGFQDDNEIVIKVFSNSDQMEYYGIPSYTIGENIWGQPIYVIDNLELVEESEFFIELDPWLLNLISLNVSVSNNQLENMFSDQVLLIIDDESNFYIPNYNVNQIGNYDYSEGYMMFSIYDETIGMNMTGQPIDHDHPILLEPYKSNMVPYFHQECLPVDYAFSSIVNQLLLVKDDDGRFYIPGSDINTLNHVCPGNAYVVYTDIDYDILFHYPEMLLGKQVISNNDVVNHELLLKDHDIYKTGISMPIIIDGISGDYNIGDDIIIYANNLKVGATKITGEFPMVVSAWKAFDSEDILLPGYSKGDLIAAKIFNSKTFNYKSLSHSFNSKIFDNQLLIGGTLTNIKTHSVPNSFNIANIYPNPFNPNTSISMDILIPGNYEFRVYNLAGKNIYTSQMQYNEPGNYIIDWDASNYASGTYIATISNDSKVISKKLTLIK